MRQNLSNPTLHQYETVAARKKNTLSQISQEVTSHNRIYNHTNVLLESVFDLLIVSAHPGAICRAQCLWRANGKSGPLTKVFSGSNGNSSSSVVEVVVREVDLQMEEELTGEQLGL